VPEAVSEALRTSFIDGVEVDVRRLPCAPSLDPLLAPVANVLHRLQQTVRKTGVHLDGECFSAADLFILTHGVPNAHWLCGCSLEVVPSADFHLPLGGILMILQEELRRVIANGCTWKALRTAFRNIVARVAPKSGLMFLLKKAGVVIGSALLGTTGALLLGVLGVFAGSWLGAKIGRRLLEWNYAIARSQLLLHGQHMELIIPKYYREAVRDIGKAAAERRAQCEKELRRNRLAQFRTLLRLRRAEDVAIDTFLEQFRNILEFMGVKQHRNLGRVRPYCEPSLLGRLFRKKAVRERGKILQGEFTAAERRLHSGRACLESESRMARLGRVLVFFREVSVNSARMERAFGAFTASIKTIDENRAGVLRGFSVMKHEIIEKHLKALAQVCERVAKAFTQKITKETQEADKRIEIFRTSGREIGCIVEVQKPWKSAA
jgi:Asp-tRNA(Asn)/Glu-tRNA(Gln) amidotransferase C subunit